MRVDYLLGVVMIMKIIFIFVILIFSPFAYSQDENKIIYLDNYCSVGQVNLRGVCVNPVAVALRDFTAATINDSGLNQTSIDFIERLRK